MEACNPEDASLADDLRKKGKIEGRCKKFED
jgi:hypothetical protein